MTDFTPFTVSRCAREKKGGLFPCRQLSTPTVTETSSIRIFFHPISKGARNALNQAVLNAYDIKLQQVQQTEIEVENSPDEEMSDDISDEPEPEISM